MLKHYHTIIIGSGPAGCTAAIYAARANLAPALVAGLEQGGQLTKTPLIENWPGAEAGISGTDLMTKMLEQAQKFSTKLISDNIKSVDLKTRPFNLSGENDEYTCDALIIATGASPRYLGIPSEEKYLGRGVSTCATCDGFFYKNKKIAIVGGGNTMAEEALYLAQIVAELTIIHRRDTLRTDPILVERLKNTPNIKFAFNYVVDEILGDSAGVTGIRIKQISDNSSKILDVTGVFLAIGYSPNTEIFANQLEMEQNYIKIGYDTQTSTSIPGVFAAGDVTNQNYRQAVTAAGLGCMAALDAKNFLDNTKI